MSKKQYAPIDPRSAVPASESLVDILPNRRSAWTAPELAELLSFGQPHIYKLAKKGRLPCIRIGGAIRFDPQTTADWLEGKAVTG